MRSGIWALVPALVGPMGLIICLFARMAPCSYTGAHDPPPAAPYAPPPARVHPPPAPSPRPYNDMGLRPRQRASWWKPMAMGPAAARCRAPPPGH